jgi:Xaa-Pro aminopeptidase
VPFFSTTCDIVDYAGILKSAQPLVESLRLTKSPAEIEMMKKSCSISARSVIEVMKATRPGISQQEINARMEFECRMRGSFRLAYPPVVASGVNNLTLHYIDNDEIVKCVI